MTGFNLSMKEHLYSWRKPIDKIGNSSAVARENCGTLKFRGFWFFLNATLSIAAQLCSMGYLVLELII